MVAAGNSASGTVAPHSPPYAPAMAFPDIQSFMRLLEDRGELLRVSVPVSHELEITEIADRLVKKGGPALLFENVGAVEFPVAIGLMGTRERTALALGVGDLDDLAAKVRALIDLKGGGGKLGMLGNVTKLRDAMNLPPRRVRTGPVQEVVWRGDEVDLARLPILKCWPLDGGPFVTLPLVITGTRDRRAQHGHVPHAGDGQEHHGDALAAPQDGHPASGKGQASWGNGWRWRWRSAATRP